MNFNDLSKQEFLDFLEQDGLTICKEGKEAFLAFDGSFYEYVLNHNRGGMAINFCASSKWFRKNVKKKFLSLVNSLILRLKKLTDIPLYVFKLKDLAYLDLEHNQLTNLSAKISKLKNLTFLNLRYNKLSGISPKIGKLKKLKKMNLENNQLTTLPSEIRNCKELKYLYLEGNNFSEQEKAKIKALLPNCEIYF